MICYDQWFPEAARTLALMGADIIFYPTAIATVDGVEQIEGDWSNAWKTVQCGHAVANNLIVAAVNRVGREDSSVFWGGSFVCNAFGHVILRGGSSGPNHDSVSVSLAQELLKKANLPQNIIVDCSHGNSHKNHKLQPAVLEDVINQIQSGNTSLKGVMIESNLFEGNQKLMTGHKEELKYGVSITDACIDWLETEHVLTETARKL